MSAGRASRPLANARLPLLVALAALTSGPDVAAQPRSMRFERLTVDDGLPQNTVNAILQDRDGFLWIATQGGLGRFDGYGFEVYQHEPGNPASLPTSWIMALAEDPASGDIWVGTEGGGLARWRRSSDSFLHFRHDPEEPASLSGDRIRTLLLDRRGDMWIGTTESGLNRLDPETGHFERFRHDPSDPGSLSHDYVQTLYEDRRGELWIGTWGGGLERFEAETGTFIHHRHDPDDPRSLSDDQVLSILEDHGGTLWAGTVDGLNRWDPASGGFVRYQHEPSDPESLGHNRVRTLFQGRSGILWLATDRGLDLLLDASGRFAHYRHDSADLYSLSNDRVTVIFQDRGGILWIGTQGGGLNKWNPATWAFSHFKAGSTATELSNNSVYAFSQDPDGQIWIGTHGGVNVLDRSQGRFRHYRHDPGRASSLSDDRVSALLHDRDGTLWIGTLAHGLNRLDAGESEFHHYRNDPDRPASLGGNAVTALFEDGAGTLWVGTWGDGLDRLVSPAGEGTFEHLRHDPGDPASLSANQVSALAEAGGFLWAGTFGGGLNRLDRDRGEFLRLRHDDEHSDSLSDDAVYTLHVAAGSLWVGTQVGLNRLVSLDDTRFEHTFRRDGLPDNVIWGIQSDGDGKLWISTNEGLARFDPETGNVESFTTSHGLQAAEFNFGAHFSGSTGELFFGGVNGFNAFLPERIRRNEAVPPVVLTRVKRFNEPLPLAMPAIDLEDLHFTHRDHFLAFEFAALDYTAPGQNQYRYRITGLEDAWISLGTERQVTFANLAPGDYTLRVQGSNNDGVWNEEGVSLRIRVAPAPWRTWWAYTLYATLALSAIAAIVRWQHHQLVDERARSRERARLLSEREQLIHELEAKNAELERFNYSVSHDLRTPLVTILNFLGKVRQSLSAGKVERLDADLRRIAEAAKRMASLLDDLLEFSRIGRQINPPRKVAIGELAREARELSAGLFDGSDIELVIAEDLPEIDGDPIRLRTVLQNLLENAVKYMGDQSSPRIELGVRREAEEDVFYVSDNGLGIDPEYHERVFGLFERLDATTRGTGVGLALARRIVELHGGRIWVESEGLGRGSKFCFTLGRYGAET